MIHVEGLTKYYGTLAAVRGLSFEVGAGEVVGFLGPNGAGKSTTLRMMAGYLGPTSGRVVIGGHDVQTDRLRALKQLGYMPEMSPLYPEMRVREHLDFRAELKGISSRKARADEVERVVERVDITDVRDAPIGELSKGYRQRVGLADALLGSPALVILDEPSAGLDPNQIRQVRSLIRGLAEEQTVVLSSHILPEVEATCDRLIVIDEGQLVTEGSIEEIRRQQAPREAMLRFASSVPKGFRTVLEACPSVASVRTYSEEQTHSDRQRRLDVRSEDGVDVEDAIADAIACAVDAGLRVVEARANDASLEDVFSRLTNAADALSAPSSDNELAVQPSEENAS